MRISFVWQGISGRYGQWKDGLWAAMQEIKKNHEVRYFEPGADMGDYKPDWVLFWEAPCTANGKDKDKWDAVCALPCKKALLFAGGPIEPMWVKDFDHIFVESQIDMDTCERFGLPHSKAFGVNLDIMKPQNQPRVWKAIHPATCASWKRTWLMTEAFGAHSLVCGRYQETDPKCWITAREHEALVLPEQSAESVAALLNASQCLCQTSDFWGGGQRATLEAIACGIPVIVMSDSPKNCEFVRESGYGVICDPKVNDIKNAYLQICAGLWDMDKALEYMKKWSYKQYANDILKILCK